MTSSDLGNIGYLAMNIKPQFYWQIVKLIVAILVGAAIATAAGCAGSASNQAIPSATASLPAAAHSATAAPDTSVQLERLAAERAKDNFSSDFPVGPGDVLEVSVPDMPELKDQLVRVSANSKIALPVVGSISTAGMTDEEVREAIKHSLTRYMRDPQVDVFVKEYQSRMVAVEGMVQKPGLYSLNNRSDTVLDMISRAGGMLENASTRVIFIPVTARASAQQPGAVSPASYQPDQSADDLTAEHGPERPAAPLGVSAPARTQLDRSIQPSFGKQDAPIVINLASVSHEGHLDVPVRPGDVIVVPAAGQVMVKGWVQNPGAFRIVPGMTVLGAVSAAGGEMFSSQAEILRTSDDGQKIEIPVDLSKVQKREEPDTLVQSGDVVLVRRSAVGAVPYAVYELFTKFSTGVPIIW